MSDLPKALRIKSSMIRMGEAISMHSECDLMDLAANEIETLRAALLAEREACAALCDAIEDKAHKEWKVHYNPADQGVEFGACECAAAIRGRE